MTDRDRAFLRTICERPDDDAPRLQYADWLEENGLVERAEFIRVQCEIAHEDACGRQDDVWGCFPFEPEGKCFPCQRNVPRRLRERELLAFVSSYTPYIVPDPDIVLDDWAFSRGFVSHISIGTGDFLRHAKAIFESQPITDVLLVDRVPDMTGNIWFCWESGNNMDEKGDVPPAIFAFLPTHLRYPGISALRKTHQESCDDLSAACVAYGRQQAGLPPLLASQPAASPA